MNGIDILVLHYLNGKNESYELNQSFWTSSYSANVAKIVKKLINNNYITLDFDLEKSLKSYKVTELKSVLKNCSLPVSGKKDELIDRIINLADKSTYQSSLKKVWVPTSEGVKIINNTDFIIYAHNHLSGYIDINDAYNEFLLNESVSQKDILINAMNKTIKFNGNTSTYPIMISYALWQLSKICRDYKDEYGQFTYLVSACVSSFNVRNEQYQIDYKFSKFEYFYNEFNISPIFINDLKMVLANNNEYSTSLPTSIDSIAKSFKGVQYFTPNEILQIITSSLEMNDEMLMSVYQKVFVRKGGKVKQKKDTPLKEIAYKQQKENNVISKLLGVFKK